MVKNPHRLVEGETPNRNTKGETELPWEELPAVKERDSKEKKIVVRKTSSKRRLSGLTVRAKNQ